MKIYHVLPLLLMIMFSSCSKDDQVENITQEEIIIETRRGTRECKAFDIPCEDLVNDNTLQILVGQPNPTIGLSGVGSSGIMDRLINCRNAPQGIDFCYRNCNESINIFAEFGVAADDFGTLGECDDDIYSAEEQLNIIIQLENGAISNAPICPIDGTQMIPLHYDIYITSIQTFSAFVTYGSACTSSNPIIPSGI